MADDDFIKRNEDKINAIRETSRWIITSFAAVAAAVLSGTVLSGIGGFPHWYQAILVSIIGVALFLIEIIVKHAITIMTITTVSIEDLCDNDVFKNEKDEVNKTINTYSKYKSINDLVCDYNNVMARHIDNDAVKLSKEEIDDLENEASYVNLHVMQVICDIKRISTEKSFKTLIYYINKFFRPISILIFLFIILAAQKKLPAPLIASPMNITISSTTNGSTQILTNSTELDCGTDAPKTTDTLSHQPIQIGPFKPASTEPDANFIGPENAAKEIIAASHERSLTGIFLIGGADKRELSPKARQEYSSNAGLAQARARSVANDLAHNLTVLDVRGLQTVMTLDAGPIEIGPAKIEQNLAKDRYVRVCLLWAQTLKSEAPPPKP